MSFRLDPAHLDRLTAFRRDLHAHPELGYTEVRTGQKVAEALTAAGVEVRTGVAKTGLLGFLPATENPSAAKTVALRADMDALPISELTGLPYASQNAGVMHACGHDGHTAILVGTAEVLAQTSERRNNVVFVFQPAEEGGAGGKKMVEEGALDGRLVPAKVDEIFGLHGFPNAHVGEVSTRIGPLLASAASFSVQITGKGSHAAYPHYGIDPIVVGAHIVTALQTVASRTVGPLDSVVVTIGQFLAGVAHNVIPETAWLNGTLRTLDGAVERAARERIESLVASIAAGFGAKASVLWAEDPYPVTLNDAGATEFFREVARDTLGAQNVLLEEHPTMGGEDFSFYGYEVPACFFFLGLKSAGQETYPNLHAPNFDFNDDAIEVGVSAMRALALR